mmetsp:Transcript_59833/g.142526  ORF Transcript_59833/g.142526 Transcript_59833/m.142526 type:complete len:873 (+) Transcript_59833:52-2670(+)
MPPQGNGVTLIVRGWGGDKPGISLACVKVVQSHDCAVLDMSQFLMHGALMFTCVLQVKDASLETLQKDLRECFTAQGLQLDFSVCGPGHIAPFGRDEGREAVAYLVSAEPISLGLLYDLDSVLCEHGCILREIEHRSDNKKENNTEFDKLQMRITCPPGLKLSTLLMGDANPQAVVNGSACLGSGKGLHAAASRCGAQITLRWWNAMNTPHGKSLVVFGLSDVLCPYDVLDQVLLEAGLTPSGKADGKDPLNADSKFERQTSPGGLQVKEKVAMLKGTKREVVDKVVEKLEFTPGARLVCSSLKRMGFRLAILTKTGVKEVAEHVKRELGIDYAICQELEVVDGAFTGKYAGTVADVNLAKADVLRLMAERESIEYGDVIVVGEPLRGMKATNAQMVLETFGPIIYFNQSKLKDLSIILYLLGFNGADVATLKRKRVWDQETDASAMAVAAHRILQVSSARNEPGQVKQICSLLRSLVPEAIIDTARLCSIQDGGACFAVDLKNPSGVPIADETAQEFEVLCEKAGFKVMDLIRHAANASVDYGVPRKPKDCWAHYFNNRHVVTMVQKPNLETTSLCSLFGLFHQHGVNIIKMDRLSAPDNLAAMSFAVSLKGVSSRDMRSMLTEVSKTCGADIAIQTDDHSRWMRRLVVFDMDSTLIQQEVIDELAKIAGVESEVKKITEAAMNGELNFFESLKARVALLKGHNAEELFEKVKNNLIFTPGAKSLCTTLRKLGYKMAVISGGFLPVAKEVQRHLGLHYAFANTLEVDESTGLLTGLTSGPVVTPQRKRALLATIADVEGCDLQQTIAVGDGANDIPMLSTAGLGIAFCAKPKVQAASEFRINQKDLSTILFLIGVSERAAERLSQSNGLGA